MNNISDHFIFQLEEIIQERIDNPIKGSYTNSLLDGGRNLIAKKLIEWGSSSITTNNPGHLIK